MRDRLPTERWERTEAVVVIELQPAMSRTVRVRNL